VTSGDGRDTAGVGSASEQPAAERQGAPATQSEAISAVVFDWGGTLSTFAEVELIDMWRLAARHFDQDREQEICERLHAVETETFARSLTDQRSATLRQILEQASNELALDVTEAVLEEAGTHYLDSWTPHIVHEPDAVATLRELQRRNIRTGLLSNTHWPRAFHEHFLERDGLADLLDVRLYTSELSHMKPHPSVFEEALRQLRVDDRLHDDVFGGRQAGMRTVWRRNDLVPRFDVEPDAVIDTLSDLPGVLDRWG
jgi:putative hydrolase of the HAD superfamily